MGLKTRESSSVAYDKSNSLAETAVGRVRPLACSLMHQLHGRIGVQLPTSSAIWTWALRHAAWLISRYSVIRGGATPYELAFGRTLNGELCEFGEPVFAYMVPNTKASARCALRWPGNCDVQKCEAHQHHLAQSYGILFALQMFFMAVSCGFWP